MTVLYQRDEQRKRQKVDNVLSHPKACNNQFIPIYTSTASSLLSSYT